jgi:acyl-[acyl-carrier-protein]-phospholipid O-acyltransferase / long-chain-fatty-acid--[acyl-carrier-protein] ligase
MSEEIMYEEPDKRRWMGFWSMIVQQTQNAFNDKAAQFILIPLGGAVGYAVESLAGMMIALPFVLFAPLAGWMSDRFSKRDVMIGAAVAQVVILSLISFAVYWQMMPLALFGFFLLAVQSTFYSPAKMGCNKELVGSRHLGFASGVQQMMAMLAILIGQVVAGLWYDVRFKEMGGTKEMAWDAAFFPLLLLTLCSLPAILLAYIIPQVPAHGKGKLNVGLLFSHFQDIKQLWVDKGLRQASYGVAYFWGFAAFINLWSVKVAKSLTKGGEGFGTLSSMFMASAMMGMVFGFGFASWLLRRRIELGWVPLAGMMMTVSALIIAFLPMGGWAFMICLGLLAFSSALFLAPLNAWMQDRYPAEKRGELQSAVNLQDCFAGIIAVVFIELMILLAGWLGIPELVGFRFQVVLVAASCGVMSWFVFRLLPADFIRLIALGAVKSIYRIKISGAEKLSKTGGVLLLPNHVTYADAFFISVMSERRVRFVMDETFMRQKAIRFSAKLFGTVPIRRDQPLEAVRKTIEALENGDVVALFPEGQLTRTGSLCEIERGFELIARKAKVPVIPVWMDGAWGSIFSFERGRFFKKWPYRLPYGLSIAVGDAITHEKPDAVVVRDAMMKAAAVAIARRFPAKANAHEVNAHQLTQLAALQRKSVLHVLESENALLPVLERFVKITGGKIVLEKTFRAVEGECWIGGEVLRFEIEQAKDLGEGTMFFDFSGKARESLEKSGLTHLPCFELDGLVVAMSMPHPPLPTETTVFQSGNKAGSWGRVLPGWYLEDGKLQPGGMILPAGVVMDASGFLVKE